MEEEIKRLSNILEKQNRKIEYLTVWNEKQSARITFLYVLVLAIPTFMASVLK